MNEAQRRIVALARRRENRVCADCGDDVAAVSLPAAVFVCRRCATIHDRLTSVDRVIDIGSASADAQVVHLVEENGNAAVNRLLEHYLPKGVAKPTADTSLQGLETWLRAKYDRRDFMTPWQEGDAMDLRGLDGPRGALRLPRRLYDYLVVFAGRAHGAGAGDAVAIDRMPVTDHPDFPLDAGVTKFCTPALTRMMSRSDGDRDPVLTTFVLTDASGARVYACALTFLDVPFDAQSEPPAGPTAAAPAAAAAAASVPKALCILSHYPVFRAMRETVLQLFRASLSAPPLPLERLAANWTAEAPLPPRGRVRLQLALADATLRLARPAPNRLPLLDAHVSPLFLLLSPASVLAAFALVAAEAKVVFHSEEPSLLAPVMETLCALLYPLRWQSVYVPLVPPFLLPLLDAPMPFLLGLRSADVPARRPPGVAFVDLDADSVDPGVDEITRLPAVLPALPAHDARKLLDHISSHAPPREPAVVRAIVSTYGRAFTAARPLRPIVDFALDGGITVGGSDAALTPVPGGGGSAPSGGGVGGTSGGVGSGAGGGSPASQTAPGGGGGSRRGLFGRRRGGKDAPRLPSAALHTNATLVLSAGPPSSAAAAAAGGGAGRPRVATALVGGSRASLPVNTSRSASLGARDPGENGDGGQSLGGPMRPGEAKTLPGAITSNAHRRFGVRLGEGVDGPWANGAEVLDVAQVRAGFLRFFTSVLRSYRSLLSATVQFSGPQPGSSRGRGGPAAHPLSVPSGLHVLVDVQCAKEDAIAAAVSDDAKPFFRALADSQMWQAFVQERAVAFEHAVYRAAETAAASEMTLDGARAAAEAAVASLIPVSDLEPCPALLAAAERGDATAADVLFFDDCIRAKLNRSNITRRKGTPFIDSDAWEHAQTFVCPPPDTRGVPRDHTFTYKRFPRFDPSRLGEPRPARALVSAEETAVESANATSRSAAAIATLGRGKRLSVADCEVLVTKIQAVARGTLARLAVRRRSAAARVLGKWWRFERTRRLLRAEFLRVRRACLTVQRFSRGCLARVGARRRLLAIGVIQHAWRRVGSVLFWRATKRRVGLFQAVARGYLQRRRFVRARRATIRLQARVRGASARRRCRASLQPRCEELRLRVAALWQKHDVCLFYRTSMWQMTAENSASTALLLLFEAIEVERPGAVPAAAAARRRRASLSVPTTDGTGGVQGARPHGAKLLQAQRAQAYWALRDSVSPAARERAFAAAGFQPNEKRRKRRLATALWSPDLPPHVSAAATVACFPDVGRVPDAAAGTAARCRSDAVAACARAALSALARSGPLAPRSKPAADEATTARRRRTWRSRQAPVRLASVRHQSAIMRYLPATPRDRSVRALALNAMSARKEGSGGGTGAGAGAGAPGTRGQKLRPL